jgi:hypothetical protein
MQVVEVELVLDGCDTVIVRQSISDSVVSHPRHEAGNVKAH